jgi:hypothetical protein
MMTDWYDKTIQALQLNGKGERTQEAYAFNLKIPDYPKPALSILQILLQISIVILMRSDHN